MNKGYLLIDALISIVVVSLITLLVYAINDLKLNYNHEYHLYNHLEEEVIKGYQGVTRCETRDLY
jgi:hypothetical protein